MNQLREKLILGILYISLIRYLIQKEFPFNWKCPKWTQKHDFQKILTTVMLLNLQIQMKYMNKKFQMEIKTR